MAGWVGEGDDGAFHALYQRYHEPLYRYCRSVVHHEADAQDAVQTAFVGALTALRRGQRNAPVRPWLFRIAHNEAISVLRRRPAEQTLAEVPEPASLSPHDQLAARERLALLVSDLRELPERQRGALVMRELSGLSHEEIALALETSVNAAKQTIFEARRSLAEFAEGRAMSCDEVCRLISDADGRMLRSRRVRAHLRDCSTCAAFAAAIPERSAQLGALAPPLTTAASAGMLARIATHASAHGEGSGMLATGAGKVLGSAVAGKVAAAVAVTATAVGVTVTAKQHFVSQRATHATHATHATPAAHAPAATTGARSAAGTGGTAAAAHRGNAARGALATSQPSVGLRAAARHRFKRGAVARVVAAGSAAAGAAASSSLQPLSPTHGHRRGSSAGASSSHPAASPAPAGGFRGARSAQHGNSGAAHAGSSGSSGTSHGNSGAATGSSGSSSGSSGAPTARPPRPGGVPATGSGSGAGHSGAVPTPDRRPR